MIQVCTRLWPEPGPRTKTVPFPASPTGIVEMPVPESERRKDHIDMIDCGHGLLSIAMDCLQYQEKERPSSEDLCQRLAGLKETREYRESIEQVERMQDDIAELQRQIGEMQVREAAAVQQLHELHDDKQQLHQRYQSEIQSKDALQKQQEQQIQKLNQQLEEQEQMTAEIQQINNSLQRQVEQLHQRLSQQTTAKPSQPPASPIPVEVQVRGRQLQEKELQPSLQPMQPQQKPHPQMRHLKLREWRDGGSRAPYTMARGAAVVDGNVAYFMNWNGHSCSYDSSTQRWSKLPRCPYNYSSLAVIRGLLTAIGGRSGESCDKLLSIKNDIKWMEHFPPMPTKRSNTAAVTTKQHLIVAGGESRSNKLDIVEVMDIQTLVWSTAASLSHPYSRASATICGDQLYMLGGFDKVGGASHSLLTCSLPKLLQSCSETSSDSVWHRIADVLVIYSTCAAVNGELVAVGGMDNTMLNYKSTAAVYKYNPTTDSWDMISNMPTARNFCLVAVLPTNEMMVVGGHIKLSSGQTDIIEIAGIDNINN